MQVNGTIEKHILVLIEVISNNIATILTTIDEVAGIQYCKMLKLFIRF
jgi:hypothetical protein